MFKPYIDWDVNSIKLSTEVHFFGGIETELFDVNVGPEVCKSPEKFNLELLGSQLASRLIWRPPDFNLPFSKAVDASNVAISAYSLQTIKGMEHSICYYS